MEHKNPPVLILGCGRSGTSIFGELFEGLAGYTYHSEPPFSHMLNVFGPNVAVKVPVETDGFPSDSGLSFPLDTVLKRVPETKLFWIVRHPFDAVCSLRIGIGKNWSHHPRPPDWQQWLNRPLLERCAHHWSYINTLGFNAVKERATLVRFEDLITSPYTFATNVLNKVGVPKNRNQAHVKAWSDRVQNTNNDQFIEAKTSRSHSRPDHSVRIGRWRENLSNEEATTVRKLVIQANHSFEYNLSIP